jgi:predicted O-methyltransferase YrrM
MKLARYSPVGGRIHEAIFAKALPRVAAHRVDGADHTGAAGLRRAVDAIRGRGIDPDEQIWIERIERRRAEFAARSTPITNAALPPGDPRREIPPRQLARISSIHRPWGVFLQRLIRELQPESCVELGTAIGISAAYQGSGLELNGHGRLLSVERSPQFAELARETLDELAVSRVEVIPGSFDDVLDGVLADAAPIDFVFMDAGKTREHVLLQFERLTPQLAPGAALIMDDIHWSREMNRAWRQIRTDERVALSVDLWRLGACLLRSG